MAPKKSSRKTVKVPPPPSDVGTSSSSPLASVAGDDSVRATASPPRTPFSLVHIPSDPNSFQNHFGYDFCMHGGSLDWAMKFSLFEGENAKWMMAILSARLAAMRAMITDAEFEVAECGKCDKPAFFFGDRVPARDEDVQDGSYKMLREVNNRLLFLPDMERMRPLSSFLDIPLSRSIAWNLTKEKGNAPLGSFTEGGIRSLGDTHIVRGLHPGCIQKKPPTHGEAVPANIFIRQFIAAGGSFPAQQFRSPGWIYSAEGGWWTRMVDFVVESLGEPLANSGLKVPVMATRRGVIQNYYNFFAMLEWYNSDASTFFTPVGELGFALHEMYEISGLPFGEVPYEEYVPGAEELTALRETSPAVYETFWEVMCHFHICAQLTGLRGGGVKQIS